MNRDECALHDGSWKVKELLRIDLDRCRGRRRYRPGITFALDRKAVQGPRDAEDVRIARRSLGCVIVTYAFFAGS